VVASQSEDEETEELLRKAVAAPNEEQSPVKQTAEVPKR